MSTPSAPTSAPWSRRAALTALASVFPSAAAGQIRTPGTPAPTVFQNVHLKLLRRVSYGVTAEDVSQIYGLGFQGYLADQLDAGDRPDPACDARLQAFATIVQPTSQLLPLDRTLVTNEIAYATITRAIYSRRQLFERMVEFWADHFNTSINIVGAYKTAEVRDVYRAHATGLFPALLRASAMSPAMIQYLNTDRNIRTAPNQNYAREVMELHTLGVNGGYTQQDIVEVARCFTGWRYNGNTNNASAGTMFFDRSRHDLLSKQVLGNTIASGGGIEDGYTVLQILAHHPSTARFIATKLLRWLLDYSPSTTLVDDVAAEFTRTGGDIRATILRILTYERIEAAPPLLKRPYHYIVSGLRALRANMTRLDTLRGTYLASVGQTPFTWAPPDGYPHEVEYWGTLLLPRWNFAFNLPNGGVGGAVVDVNTLLAGATTAAQVADRIDTLIFQDEMPGEDKAALIRYLRPDPPTQSRRIDALGLALASPSFQWH
jgi:Protein of unknown function (DUF1800)